MTKNIKIQLYGKVEGYLTLTEDSDFPFTLSLADIKDLSKRKSTTSKSISIAGTDENNRILSYYFDVNVDPNDLYFNINKIQKCCIFVNDDMFMDNCIMQLTAINKVQPNSQREYSIVYEINIKSNQADFFGAIQDKELTDIEFTTADVPGNAGGGFVYNATFVKNSFNNTYTDGYKFLYQKTTSGKITLPMFKPATYLWTYWNRIIKDAGFRYTFPEIGVTNSVLTDPTRDDLFFRRLLVPFTNKAEGTTMNNVVNYAASAAKAGGAVTINGLTSGVGSQGLFAFPTSIPSSDPIIANTIELNDPSNSYTPTSYTAQFTGNLTVTVGQRYAGYINNFNAFDIFTYTGVNAGYAKLQVRNRIFKNGVDTGIETRTGTVTIQPTAHTWTASTRTLISIEAITTSLTVSVVAGDVITVKTGFAIEEGTGNKRHRMVDSTPAYVGNFRPEVDIQSMTLTYSVSIPNAGLSFGGVIDMNNFIPQKVKQAEFFKSILNMHNIYVYADKYDENLLIFTTRDNYYDTGVKKDFTQKFIKEMEHSHEFLSEISNKRMYMSYKQDKYIDNEAYFNEYNKTYGSATFIFDNEYVKGEDKLEIIFSPSPINMDGDKYVTDLTTQDSLRLLFDTGERSCNSYQIVNYPGNESTATTYPITTHLDDPNTPTYDLNFGTAESYFHNYSSMTSTNLINTYWRRTFHQINKSRLFTCYLYLTDVDIRNISLNDIIYLDNAYYYINKIIDFNPTKTYKTKVELISIDDLQSTGVGRIINWGDTKPVEPWVPTPNGGTVKPHIYGNIVRNFTNGNAGTIGGLIGIGNVGDSTSVIIGDNSVADGKGSTIIGNGTISVGNMVKSLGDTNMIYGNNVQVSGVDNVITANNVVSNGDENVLDSPGIYLGSNITAPANLGNVLVVGDNITPSAGGIWTDQINGIPTTSFLTPTLAQVLINGNTTGANNIIMSGSTNIGSGITNNIAFNSGIVLTATAISIVGGYSIPVVDGTAGQVLTTNGSGVASWQSPGGLSSRLTAWDAYNSNGIVVQTSSTTWVNRTIVAPASGITISNGNGISANPTLALANDLNALENLASTGFAVRTATDTWAQRTITGTAGQITVTNGNGVSGNPVLALDATFVTNNSLWRPGSSGTNSIRTQSGFNDATDANSFVVGGSSLKPNSTSGVVSAVVGGFNNTQTQSGGFILGGANNTSASNWGGIIGGIAHTNNASTASVIIGGQNNVTVSAGDYSVIAGGDTNQIASSACFIAGGSNNTISSSTNYSSIIGGTYNTARGGDGNAIIGLYKGTGTTITYASGKSSLVAQGYNTGTILGIMSIGSAWSTILGGNDNYMGVNGNATANSLYNSTIIGSQGCAIYQSSPSDTSLMIYTGIYGGNNSYIRSLANASNLRTCNIIGAENSNITNNTGAQVIGNIIMGGSGHTLTNTNNATILGGTGHSATSVSATLQYGVSTVVTEFGERASGIGQLSSLNNQEGTLQLNVVTTNNTLTNLTTGAGLAGINIPTNTAYLFDISTMATITSATNRGSTRTWSGRILVKNIAGVMSAVVITAYNASTGDTGATTFASSVSTFSGTRFLVRGTGTAGTTVSWHSRLNYQKIQFA